MRPGSLVLQPALEAASPVALDDPATGVMTDLARVPAVLIDPDVDIEAAMGVMIRRNVHSLFAGRGGRRGWTRRARSRARRVLRLPAGEAARRPVPAAGRPHTFAEIEAALAC